MPGSGRILVAAPSSFLARAFLATVPPARVLALRHDALGRPPPPSGLAAVVSFGRAPGLGGPDWAPEQDADMALAAIARERGLPFLFLSTRKVYAPAGPGLPLPESAPLGPADAYGRGKLALERALAAVLGERLTVLRLANVFGFEAGRARRTFAGIMLDSLRSEGRIVLDVAATTARDFLPAAAFARILARLVDAPPGGVLNVGSGTGQELGRIAACVIEGYGSGRIEVLSDRERDGFVLDTTRLAALAGPLPDRKALEDAWRGLGRRLRDEPLAPTPSPGRSR
ncbi:NAD-dependent epimerase/dehydratase family protein [Marinivivus vitaminiproducens]|uniref:NAD-dependent epimerase/dehydratase family protein n=1 Tax=Marinivivus vitaminiproducens TaxID=3035935 RepID=UPI0027AA54ED|nr:sugar nucleotide-binding protein [Geminicoccaceae bacterium SCSIO 64248]